MMVVFVIYTLIAIPYEIAWDLGTAWIAISVIVEVAFVVDIWLNFRTAYRGRDDELIVDRLQIAKHYAKTVFVLDLIASVPLTTVLLLLDEDDSSGAFALLKLFKVFRLFRISRVFRLIAAFQLTAYLQLGLLFSGFILMAHWCGCIFFRIPFLEGTLENGQENWIQVEGLEDADDGTQYQQSLYWAITTITTVGYGDITPVTQGEQIYVMFVMAFGAIFYATIIGTVGRVLTERFAADTEYHARMQGRLYFSSIPVLVLYVFCLC